MQTILLVPVVSLLLISTALAQNALPLPFPPLINMRGTPEDQAACKKDAVTLCKPVLGDDMAVLSCFQRQRAKLSRACNAVLVKYGQ